MARTVQDVGAGHVGPVPERSLKEWQEHHTRTLWTPYIQMRSVQSSGPLLFERAEGVHLYDAEGREYIDAHASLWLANVGYGRTEIVDAVHDQMMKLPYFSMFMGFTNRPAIELAEKLIGLTAPEGMGKVFYSDSGSESVETALKIARQYWRNVGRAGKYKFISRRNAYHGVTFGAMSATGIAANRQAFGPLLPGFRHIPEPNRYRNEFGTGLSDAEISEAGAAALRAMIEFEGPETVAAFIAEPVQGAGGVIVPPEDYLRRCREICTQYEVLFIADEVITGFGRVGSWFGSRRYGVRPDIMCFAKGITSGYVPLGATMCSDEIFDAFLGEAGDGRELRHGNTYSGHAAAAAAAIANLRIVEREGLPENSRVVGEHFFGRLKSLERHEVVGDVDGIGLLARVELVADRATRRPFERPGALGAAVQKRAQELGVIFRNVGDVLTFSPPLILTTDQADRIVEVIDRAIADVAAAHGARG
jgi:adenosylmethionine-8-amino-7-oxononanoate transaminase